MFIDRILFQSSAPTERNVLAKLRFRSYGATLFELAVAINILLLWSKNDFKVVLER